MTPNFEKLKNLFQMENSHLKGYLGFFEKKEKFDKLVAYAKKTDNGLQFLWIHRDYKK